MRLIHSDINTHTALTPVEGMRCGRINSFSCGNVPRLDKTTELDFYCTLTWTDDVSARSPLTDEDNEVARQR